MSTLITSKNFKSYENLACVTEFYDSKLENIFVLMKKILDGLIYLLVLQIPKEIIIQFL